MRFYLRYIEKNKGKIENDQFNERSITTLPGWDSIIGLQFENLVLNNRKMIWDQLRIYPEEIIANNPFFQRKTAKMSGCQIDYLIQASVNTLYACEIKFSKKEITSAVVQEVQEKLKRLSLPRGFSCVPILIHVNGVQDSVEEKEYFKKIIDLSTLLED